MDFAIRTAAEKIADFVSGLKLEAIPPPTVRHAKQHLLDWLGCAIAGGEFPPARTLARLAAELGGAGEATIFGSREKGPAPLAALANGTGSHSLEADDATFGHPSVCVIPAALGTAELVGASGPNLLTAIIAGYEVFLRLGRVLYSGRGEITTAHEKALHPTGLVGSFGAAAAAAFLLRLPPPAMVNAFGICGSQASGILEALDTPAYTKTFQAGWAAHAGVMAARMAKLGFTGPSTVLEGRLGFFRAFAEGFDQSRLFERLGQDFLMDIVAYKPYACCRASHPSMTAARELVTRQAIRVEEIEEIRCEMMPHCFILVTEPKDRVYAPRLRVEAQFSLPWGVAALLVRGRALVEEFGEETLRNEEVLGLARKVFGAPDPLLDERRVREGVYPSRVTIRTKSGTSFTHSVDAPLGHPKHPLSADQLQEKFRAMVAPSKKDEQASALIAEVNRIDTQPELSAFTRLLR